MGESLRLRPGLGFGRHSGLEPESIFAFVFSLPRSDVFMPGRGGSESNAKTKGECPEFRIPPRDDKVVAVPPGEKSKWIPVNPSFISRD